MEERLTELDTLVEEAEAKKLDRGVSTDVWRWVFMVALCEDECYGLKSVLLCRPNIDISTAIYSRSIPVQEETVGNLEKELQDIEAENRQLSLQLDQYMESEEMLRTEASVFLQRLDEVSRL